MPPTLTAHEARVIGCLMEKATVTPDQYPLTLNALTNAANQKSSREPVLSLDPGTVQRVARDLNAKHLVRIEEHPRTGAEKYKQRFCNTTYSDYQFGPAEFAIICLLLLRGAQTPGEMKARSGRLHTFDGNSDVANAITALVEREGEPLLVKLPRTLGRKDAEYMHLFCGPIDIAAHAVQAEAAKSSNVSGRSSVSELAERVSVLEMELAALKGQLGNPS